jgi:hypothetical protein
MTGAGAGVAAGLGGETIAITAGGVVAGAGSDPVGDGATAMASKGTDLARLDIRGWALDATDPAIRIEIRRHTDTDRLNLRFRF